MRSKRLRDALKRVLRRVLGYRPLETLTQDRTFANFSLLLILAAAAVVVCSFIDNTIKLPGTGRGFSRHYGIWAIFAGSPVLVIVASITRASFLSTIHHLKTYTIGAALPNPLQAKVDKHIAGLNLQTKTRYALLLFVVVGHYCWLINIEQTIYPYDSYGNDVFDAYPHLLGFIAFKLYLGVLWVLVLPLLAYVAAHVFFSMMSILRYMSINKLFKLDFFHEDDCGGVSVFGRINLLITSMMFIVFLTVLAILFTHEGNYASIWSAIITTALLIVLQTTLGVYYIHTFVRCKKAEILEEINRALNRSLLIASQGGGFSQDLLSVRNHIAKIRSFPYAKGSRFLVNFLRLSPAAAGLLNVILKT